MSEAPANDVETSVAHVRGVGENPAKAGQSPIGSLYWAVTENLPETSVTVFDRDLRFQMAYGEALKLNGWSREDLDGKTASEVLPPDHLALLAPMFEAALAGKRSSAEVPSLDGTRTLLTHVAPVEEDGIVVGGVAIGVDITERKRDEDARSRLAAIVEQSEDAIVGISRADTISAWNQGAERLFQYSADEAIGGPLQMLVPAAQLKAELDICAQVHAGETVERLTQRLRRDGTLVDVSVIGSPIRDAGGTVIGASEIARDISERKRTEAQLEHLASHDPLTGLLNRRAFETELAAAVTFAKRYEMGTTLLMVDVDHFKTINDTYGHAVGDAVLRRVANLMRARLRETDVVARPGGDEFAAILHNLTSNAARAVADELLTVLRSDATVRVEGHSVAVTASVGLAEIRGDMKLTPEELLAHADAALYEAKACGRDAVAVTDLASPSQLAFKTRLTWAKRIRQAIDQNGLLLYEQPILSLSTGRLDRRELLLRMRTERGELIDANSFVGIAERFGHMRDIDLWVVRQALDTLESENGSTDSSRVHINLSGASMSDPEFIATIPMWVAAAKVDPKRLVFEITETAAIQTIEHAQRLSRELSALGCEIALDDFGSGFGSFYYLKHLPFDCLKVDGSFTRKLTTDNTDRVTVRAMIDIAQGLGKSTVAECVEDKPTLELVREFGFDHAQGFHIGKPVDLNHEGPVRLC